MAILETILGVLATLIIAGFSGYWIARYRFKKKVKKIENSVPEDMQEIIDQDKENCKEAENVRKRKEEKQKFDSYPQIDFRQGAGEGKRDDKRGDFTTDNRTSRKQFGKSKPKDSFTEGTDGLGEQDSIPSKSSVIYKSSKPRSTSRIRLHDPNASEDSDSAL